MKEKIRIMKAKPQVSEEEIRSFMDFEALIVKKELLEGPGSLRSKRIVLKVLATALVLFATVFYFTGMENTPKQLQGDIQPTTPEAVPSLLPSDSLIAKANPGDRASAGVGQNAKRENEIGPQTTKREPSAPQPSVHEPREEKKPIYFQAEPAEGYPSLYDYFGQQLVYPLPAVKDSIEGVVNVVFEIDTTGRPVNIGVENSLGALFDKEAIRLVKNMPPWKPAYYNGKPVKSKISLPIDFSITRILNPE